MNVRVALGVVASLVAVTPVRAQAVVLSAAISAAPPAATPSAPAVAAPGAAGSTASGPAVLGGREAPTFAISAVTATAPLGTAEAAAAQGALVARLGAAYGTSNVSTSGTGRFAVTTTLSAAQGGVDAAVTVADGVTGRSATADLIAPSAAALPPPARFVALVDRASILPAAQAEAGLPLVALFPLRAPPDLADAAIAATGVLAARLRETGLADVVAIDAGTANDPSALGRLGARVTLIGALAKSGNGVQLRLDAFGPDRATLGSFSGAVPNPAVLPPPAVFAPTLAGALDAAPAGPGGAVDVAVLPFGAPPELAEAAETARVALVDRMLASGATARAADTPGSAPTYVTATFSKTEDGYRVVLVGHAVASNGAVQTAASLAAPALLPGVAAVGSFVSATKAAATPPAHRLIFVPYVNPSNKDGYIGFANAQVGKLVGEHGYALVPKPELDPVDARLGAPELCKANGADGILIGSRIDHDQEYHKGALRTFGSFLGFFTFGVGNALVNGLGNIASDDRYVNRANMSATLVDCSGKRVWSKTVQGGNSHYGRNAAAGGSGAISDGAGQLVSSLFATWPGSRPATPAPGAGSGSEAGFIEASPVEVGRYQ